jgi:hypothetical protein
MRRTLQLILIAGGIAAVLIALGHIALGPAVIPGSVSVNATMDSEDRFYATIFLGFGLALLWCARSVERRGKFIRFLAAIFFFAGVARVVSMLLVGLPNLLFQALTVLELLLPPLIFVLLNRVERQAAR